MDIVTMTTNEEYTTQSKSYILGYRIILAILGISTLLVSHYLSSTNPVNSSFSFLIRNLRVYRYFTMQTNLLVIIWLILAIIWSSDPNKMEKLMGKLKGALTLYITVTFIIFAIILSPLYQPSGIDGIINLMVHYIIPIGFIIDWFITENNSYEWQFIPYWLIYPICYLVFVMIHGVTLDDFIYPFLNIDSLGVNGLVISVIFLILFFIGLSSLYIVISQKFLPFKKYFS